MSKKVLFLSEDVGAGHVKAAESIIDQLKLEDPEIRTLRVDTFRYVNRMLNRIITGTYLEIIRFTPRVYGFLYSRALTADDPGVANDFKKIINTVVATKLRKLIDDFSPDLIVCTNPFPAGIMSVFKKRHKISAPIYGIITDFTIHPFWIYDNIDLYFVAAEKLRNDLITKGVDSSRIVVSGIPIDTCFDIKYNASLIKNNMCIAADRFVVLVMGGSLGLGGFDAIFDSLNNAEPNIHVLFVAGKNKDMAASIERAKERFSFSITVFGYTDRIAELMAVSDLLITKPGGLTSSEAITMGLPMLIYEPIPGQETRNTDFLLHSEVALCADSEEALGRLISYLCNDKEQLGRMRQAALSKGKPNAARHVTERIFKEINT